MIHQLGNWYQRYWERRRQDFTRLDAVRLASGRTCAREQAWDVPFWLSGRHIATVRCTAASQDGALCFAEIYLKANLYPHKFGQSVNPLPDTGKEICFPDSSTPQSAGQRSATGRVSPP